MTTIFDPPYPLDALAPTLRHAAEFIELTNQTPTAMCACSVLAAAGIVAQGLVVVHWRSGQTSPISQVFMLEAETGERKSANDRIAFSELLRFDAEQAALADAEQPLYVAAVAAWKAKIDQLLKSIRKAAGKGDSTDQLEAELGELQKNKPKQRLRPRMLLKNLSRQALAKRLAESYPYGALYSDEGGIVLNSDAFGDAPMINVLWDGGTWSSDRITRARVELRGCRLFVYLQIQPEMMDDFLGGRGKQILRSGLASRWQYARPGSRQGTRLHRFIDIPTDGIERYHASIRALLREYEGAEPPTPRVLTLSESAAELLKWFGEKVELELVDGGWFCTMRGNASKIVEICARIAAAMHTFERYDGPISVEVIRGAIMIGAWHLNQHRLRFCPKSKLEIDALLLEEFLIRKFPMRRGDPQNVDGLWLCQFGPRPIRNVDRLFAACEALQAAGKLQLWGKKGQRWGVHLAAWSTHAPGDGQAPSPMPMGSRFADWGNAVVDPPETSEPPQNGYQLWPGVYLPT